MEAVVGAAGSAGTVPMACSPGARRHRVTSHLEERSRLQQCVAYVGGSRRRAFDAVVIQIDHFNPDKPKRSVVLHTSGTQHQEVDKARLQRLCRRLRKAGVTFTTDGGHHPLNGMGFTVFGYTK